jgi:hypothetical protein
MTNCLDGPPSQTLKKPTSLKVMLCVYCNQPVSGATDHKLCQESVWLANTENLEALKKQYDFVPKGCTVDVREPLTRSVSR